MKKLIPLIIILLLFGIETVRAQGYVFEYEQGVYEPLDTNTVGNMSYGNRGLSAVGEKFLFPFSIYETNQESVFYSFTGSLFFEFNGEIGVNGRVELMNSSYVFKDDSYIASKTITGNEYDVFVLDYHNFYLESDSDVYVNFQCIIYEFGAIEIIYGPSNLDYELDKSDGFYVGLDTMNFAWTYFLTGDPDAPTIDTEDKDAVLTTAPSEGMTYRFFYSNETGKKEMPKSDISLYPNPCTDRLMIENNGEELRSYEVIAVDGKSWKKEAMSSTGMISTDQLPPGAYFLKLTYTNDEVLLRKFLKR